MTVALTTSGRIQPGRYNDFVAQATEAAKIYERLGTAPPRLHLGGLAGEAFWSWTYTVEYEDLDSFGEISDQWNADAEAQAFLLRLSDPANPAPIERAQLCVQVPVHTATSGRGSQLAIYASRVHPGQQARAFDLAGRACAFIERHGGLNARVWNLMAAGSGTGMAVMTVEFDSVRSYARAMSAFSTDQDGQAIAAEGTGKDAPDTVVFEGLYGEIPL